MKKIIMICLITLIGYTAFAQKKDLDRITMQFYTGLDLPTNDTISTGDPYFGYEFGLVIAQYMFLGLNMEGKHTVYREADSYLLFKEKLFTYGMTIGFRIPSKLNGYLAGSSAGFTYQTVWENNPLDPEFPGAFGPFLQIQFNPFDHLNDKNDAKDRYIDIGIFVRGTYIRHEHKNVSLLDVNPRTIPVVDVAAGITVTLGVQKDK